MTRAQTLGLMAAMLYDRELMSLRLVYAEPHPDVVCKDTVARAEALLREAERVSPEPGSEFSEAQRRFVKSVPLPHLDPGYTSEPNT